MLKIRIFLIRKFTPPDRKYDDRKARMEFLSAPHHQPNGHEIILALVFDNCRSFVRFFSLCLCCATAQCATGETLNPDRDKDTVRCARVRLTSKSSSLYDRNCLARKKDNRAKNTAPITKQQVRILNAATGHIAQSYLMLAALFNVAVQ